MTRPLRIALKLELGWPFEWHQRIFVGAQRYAEERGWETIIDETLDDAARYDGIISRASQEDADYSLKHRTPLVNVMFGSSVADTIPSVVPDYTASGAMRAEHFLERGYHNFAVLNGANKGGLIASAEFIRVVSAAGFPYVTARVPTRNPIEREKWRQTEDIIDRWMDRWRFPLGVYVDPPLTARIIVQKCHARGWRIPEDVGVVCGENDKLLCEELSPSISGTDLAFDNVGYQAAKLLEKLMCGRRLGPEQKNERPPVKILIPPIGVVVRESSDIHCVNDQVVASALAYISSNMRRKMSQDDVAKAVSVGLKTLQLRFRQALNRPIAAVIRRMRIDQAKRALLQSDRSIADIAREAGFITPERMNEVFRRELRMSPTAFRASRNA